MRMGNPLNRRVGFLIPVTLVVLATAVPAVAEESTHRVAGNPAATFSASFLPKALSMEKPTPIRLAVTARFGTDAKHPPPLKQLRLRLDRHVSVNLRRMPIAEDVPGCLPGSGPRRRVGQVRRACGPAVVGNGRIKVVVQFPDQAPVPVESELLALNAARRGDVKLHLYAYFPTPVTSAFVSAMEFGKVRGGRYGLEAVARLPKIAGGNGSITSFALALKRGVISATCPNGRLYFHGRPVFEHGAGLGVTNARACTPKLEGQR